MVRLGIIAFLIGAAFTLIAMSPLVTGADLPSILWFLAMLMGVGLLMVLLGMLRGARERGAAVRRASSGGA